MNPQLRSFTSIVLIILTLASGCKPLQPFYFYSDGEVLGKGDLSHYVDVATEIDYPDVHEQSLEEVQTAAPPLTLDNSDSFDYWDLSLEEVTRITLANSKVLRQLGGRITDNGSNIAGATPETITQNPAGIVSTFDPALVETGNGTATGSQFSGTGVEAALAEFDAVLDSSLTFQSNDRPQNFASGAATIFNTEFQQSTGNYTAGITKISADGTTFEVRNNTIFDSNNNGSRAATSDWVTNFEMAVSHPLLQGRGTQLNRIAGPQTAQQSAAGVINQIDGVMISRIRTDITLSDFEQGVRDLMRDVEDAYWELFYAYQELEARKIGRDSAAESWKKVKALQREGAQGGEANQEAQARSQYWQFHSQAQSSLTNLFRLENNLRYMMGLSHSDGRLIRPGDRPTAASVHFDWGTIHAEALARRSEIRRQKWQIKRRELELIATKNNLMPRLDLTGRYRFLGAGDDFLRSDDTGVRPFGVGSNAFESLVTGDYQEWEAGFQLSMPFGFRRGNAGVRHHQLLLALEKATLQDMELEISHQLASAIRDVDLNFARTQSTFNQRVAAQDEEDSVRVIYDTGRVTLDLLLDAQRRRADAETAFYRSLVDYNRAIMRVHHRKGSLLEYNGVFLAEGPWPGKAHFDALRRARERDAGFYLNYGYTRPEVISRGPQPQFMEFGHPVGEPTPVYEGPVLEEEQTIESPQELIPIPEPTEGNEARLPEVNEQNGVVSLPTTYPSTFSSPIQQTSYEVPISNHQPTYGTPQPIVEAARPLPMNPYRSRDSRDINARLERLPTEQEFSTNPLRPQNLYDPQSVRALDDQNQSAGRLETAADPVRSLPSTSQWIQR